jgi:aspartyl-tRNA(Asn)/glutamyl-tRNA(Gln) amidotransferase subunit C
VQSSNAHDIAQGGVYHCVRVAGRRFAGSRIADKSMSLDKDQVQHIAVLARLRVADEEIADTVDKLSRIVDFVDQLSQADTTDVVPMAHPLDAAQRLRPDVVMETDRRDEIQENAPAVSDGFYLVPKVIE